MTGSGSNTGAVGGDDGESAYVQSLERYRRRLEGAMLAGDVAWWEMDVESGDVAFHDNKVEMLGLSPADFEHYEDFTERVHPDDHDRAMEAMRDHLEGRTKKYDVEYRIRGADGEYRWFHDVGGITDRHDDGSPRTVTGIVVEITRRKRAEERLRTSNEQLALLNRIIRHDIRNDMAVVTGWLDPLEDDLPAEERDALDRARRAAAHTTQLTESVGDLLSVLEGGEASLNLEPIDAVAVLDREIDRVRTTHETVEVRTDYGCDAALVQANAMLSSLFGNVLNNAVQHTDEPITRLDVSVTTEGDRATVRVADNGPGIPEAVRDDLFEREAKGAGSMGSGLGLYLVHTLTSIYGGSVRVEDNEPKGTVVVVELPLAESP